MTVRTRALDDSRADRLADGRADGLADEVRPTSLLTRSAGAYPWLEWALLLGGGALLLAAPRLAGLGLALLVVAAISRRLLTGRWMSASVVDRPLVGLLAMALIALVPSVRLDYSLPRLYGLLVGMAVLLAVLNTCRTQAAFGRAAVVLLGAGATIAVVGVAGMAVPPEKLAGARAYALLFRLVPHFDPQVQSSTIATQGFEPNELAGVLALFAPLAVCLALADRRLRWAAVPVALLTLSALVLTQSRIALIGVAVALAVGGWWLAQHRALVLAGAACLGALAGAMFVAGGRFAQLGSLDLPGRADLWRQATLMVLDMPLTGIGLNTFPQILVDFYPPVMHGTDALIPHAHDLFLQAAVDLGLPGLDLFLVVLGLAVRSGVAAIRSRHQSVLAAGLLLGLLAHGIYSLVDAVALGAKAGVMVWVFLGLLLALRTQTPATLAAPEPQPRRVPRVPQTALLAGVAVLLVPLLIAPLSVNAALLSLHRSSPVAVAQIAAELQAATHVAWGPYASRVQVARGLALHQLGDSAGEVDALAAAAAAAPWDPSLALELGTKYLELGQTDRAIETWRRASVLEPLLERGAHADGADALTWFRAAQQVAPQDPRGYLGAGRVLVDAGRVGLADSDIQTALQLEAGSPACQLAEQRLADPSATLDTTGLRPTPDDREALSLASYLLENRGDLEGAYVVGQLAVDAEPAIQPNWFHLMDIERAMGRMDLVEQTNRGLQRVQGVLKDDVAGP